MAPRHSTPTYVGWTTRDRAAWEQMLSAASADFLDDRPVLAGWAHSTQSDARRTVTRFLRWLESRVNLPAESSLAQIVTPELLLAYGRHCLASQKAAGVAYQLQLIATALQVFDPDRDWTWIRGFIRRLKVRATREGSVVRPIVHAAVLYDLGRRLMHEAAGATEGIDNPLFRSGLIIALLAAAPMRIGNLAALELGRHLRNDGECWVVHLPASETKTRRADTWPIPRCLGPALEMYLEVVRPALLARARKPVATAELWIGDSGRPIGHQVLRPMIATMTRERLGVQINPHTFRHCAATTFALERPHDALQSSALLGHASPKTAEKHYIVQQRQLVQRGYLALLKKRQRSISEGCNTSDRPYQRNNSPNICLD